MFLFVIAGDGRLGLKDQGGDREARRKRLPCLSSRRTQKLGRIRWCIFN